MRRSLILWLGVFAFFGLFSSSLWAQGGEAVEERFRALEDRIRALEAEVTVLKAALPAAPPAVASPSPRIFVPW